MVVPIQTWMPTQLMLGINADSVACNLFSIVDCGLVLRRISYLSYFSKEFEVRTASEILRGLGAVTPCRICDTLVGYFILSTKLTYLSPDRLVR